VVNNSRVRKARVIATTAGGGRRELLFLRHVRNPSERGLEAWEVMTRRPSRLREGAVLHLPGDLEATVAGHGRDTLIVRLPVPLSEPYFDRHGHVPLPPYIRRDDEHLDEERYQTVFASRTGSVAAPTAGLHLTESILSRIAGRGISVHQLTLHVGPGTFLPVRTDNVDEHEMHHEEYEVSTHVADALNAARLAGKRITAVGTTSVRTLESAYDVSTDTIRSGGGSTDLFIRPGFRFNVVEALLTNFHTPESTLLMLVCAFASRDRVLAAYGEAVENQYRFFSYGDGMLIQ
jgi:S-adenosylmethionine:tRNA ribosyltransferase-isomerase